MLPKPKRVAICVGGQLRTFRECLPAMKKHLLEPLEADVFVATWAQLGGSHKEKFTTRDIVSPAEVIEAFGARSVLLQEFKLDYFNELGGIFRPERLALAEPVHSKSALPSFYMINRANQLKKNAELEDSCLYDIVIRIRPDLFLEHDLSWLQDIHIPEMSVWCANHAIDPAFQVSDKFALGRTQAMDLYADLFWKLPDYWGGALESVDWKKMPVGERLVKRYCCDVQLKVRHFSAGCRILRWETIKAKSV